MTDQFPTPAFATWDDPISDVVPTSEDDEDYNEEEPIDG